MSKPRITKSFANLSLTIPASRSNVPAQPPSVGIVRSLIDSHDAIKLLASRLRCQPHILAEVGQLEEIADAGSIVTLVGRVGDGGVERHHRDLEPGHAGRGV